MQPEDVLFFWRDAGPQRWFRKDEQFDREFRERFAPAHEAAVRGELDTWADSANGALALLILLDQFPRNAFRGTPRMFETDDQARAVARKAVKAGLDACIDAGLRQFFYLPFTHSEDPDDQDLGLELNRKLGGEPLRFAIIHRDIIQKFGRFPHRNAVLGRSSTAEEQRFLGDGGFAG